MDFDFSNISNSELSSIIGEWVKGERDRQIMHRRLIDQVGYEKLAEEFELSVRWTKHIVHFNKEIILKHINK